MASPSQHYLPRFLQRQFAARKRGSRAIAWCFRQGAEPFESAVENVGAERDFLASEADDRLTTRESVLANFIHACVNTPTNVELDSHLAAELVASLSIRSRNLRQGMSQVASEVLASKVGELESKDPSEFLELMEARGQEVPEGLRKDALRLAAQAQVLIRTTVDRLGYLNPETLAAGPMRGAQSKVVASGPPPRARFESLRWTKRWAEPANAILGDVAAICWDPMTSTFRPAMFAPQLPDAIAIILPISPRELLVGVQGRMSIEIDSRRVNEASARLSESFFLAHENGPIQRALHDQLSADFSFWRDKARKP